MERSSAPPKNPRLQMRITIGLPYRDSARTLLYAIESVLAQTFTDWRLILINDGSNDTSVSIAGQYADARIVNLNDGRVVGLPARLNEITRLTQTPFLARMDADDIMHRERLMQQLEYLQEHPGMDLVSSAAYIIDDRNRVLCRSATPEGTWNLVDLLRVSPIIHPTVMGRTEWFSRHPYDARYERAEDHELWVRTHADMHRGVLREPLMFYRQTALGDYAKYRQSHRTDRRIMREYGPSMVGRWRAQGLIVRSLVKDIVHAAVLRSGAAAVLRYIGTTRNQRINLSEPERLFAQAELEKAIAGCPAREAL
jgi:glycosyltransferase involved in cell wall biosynthesis